VVHTIDFNAHFDGKVIVPEMAVDLPRDRSFNVHIETWNTETPEATEPQSALAWLAENAVEDDLPTDLSEQHDHYLYGTKSAVMISIGMGICAQTRRET
jgi:hypothetical protein